MSLPEIVGLVLAAALGGLLGGCFVLSPTIYRTIREVYRHGIHNDRRCHVMGCCR